MFFCVTVSSGNNTNRVYPERSYTSLNRLVNDNLLLYLLDQGKKTTVISSRNFRT
jgi:hypothetical protein